MTKSRVLRKLRAGEFVMAGAVSRVTEPWLIEVIGRTGHDLIWFDMEHRQWDMHHLDPISLACRATGIDLMARIVKSGYHVPMQALEFGANGLMIPHVRSVEEARQWVDWVRFPPLGRRGFDGAGADADWALADPLEHIRYGNEEVFLVFQVEDREAVDHIDDIAAVPGFDLMFVGPGDLSISLGTPFQFAGPVINDAIDRVAAAAKKHGKWWGMPTGTPEAAQRALDRGARLITAGGDHMFLLNGYRNAYEQFSKISIKK